MSDPRSSRAGGRDPRPDVLLTIVTIMAGVILLAPGICTIYVFGGDLGFGKSGGGNLGALYQALHVWLVICLVLAVGGVVLIVLAVLRWGGR
jgi:hypothetical protein